MISTSGKHVLLIGHVFIVSSAAPNVTRETSIALLANIRFFFLMQNLIVATLFRACNPSRKIPKHSQDLVTYT